VIYRVDFPKGYMGRTRISGIPRIISDPSVFLEGFLPESLAGRKTLMQEIEACLAPSLRRDKPENVWIWGPVGSGKTAVAKSILRKLTRETRAKGCYVNCWEHDSLYSVLDCLVTELRILGAEQQDTAFKLERLRRAVSDGPFIVVLDETDRPEPKDREAIIHGLLTLERVGLVCISDSEDAYFALDERVKSRLNPKMVPFQPYSDREILEILTSRAEKGLARDSWTLPALERIAHLAKGDARIAILTLHNAAEAAELESAAKVTPGYVEKGWNHAKDVKKNWLLRNLTADHRLLYRMILRRREILSGELWEFYQDHCAATGKDPIALRTFSDYVNDLGRARLIEITRARVRGKVRLLKALK